MLKMLGMGSRLFDERGVAEHGKILALGGAVQCDALPSGCFPVDLRDSPLHGKGLFATHDIKKGQVVTKYPADVVLKQVSPEKKLAWAGPSSSDFDFDVEVYMQNLMSGAGINTEYSIAGDPRAPFRPDAAGHFINDPYPDVERLERLSKLDLSRKLSRASKVFGRAWMDYHLRVKQLANCVFRVSEHFSYVVATRDIKAGEELLAPYGVPYWVHIRREAFNLLLSAFKQTLKPQQAQICEHLLSEYVLGTVPLSPL